jgi:hypothetical protein
MRYGRENQGEQLLARKENAVGMPDGEEAVTLKKSK